MANKITDAKAKKRRDKYVKPPTIAERKAGAIMPGKPPTISEQKLIKQYGDLPTAKRVIQQQAQLAEFEKFKSKEQEQKKILQDKLIDLNKQFELSAERWKAQKWDVSTRRVEQAEQRRIEGEREIYEQALKGLEKGGYYRDLGAIQRQAKSYGTELKRMEQRMFAARAAKDKAKDKAAQEAGFSSYKQLLSKTKYTTTTVEGTTFILEPEVTTTQVPPETLDLSGFQVKKDLKDLKDLDKDVTGVYLGAPISDRISMDKVQPDLDRRGNFFTRFAKIFKADIQAEKTPYYDPKVGAFVSAKVPGATPEFVRFPTEKEKKRFERVDITKEELIKATRDVPFYKTTLKDLPKYSLSGLAAPIKLFDVGSRELLFEPKLKEGETIKERIKETGKLPGFGTQEYRTRPEREITIKEPQFGTLAYGDTRFKDIKIKKEEKEVLTFAGIVPGAVKTAAYLTPAGAALIASEAAVGTEKVFYPEEEANKIMEDLYSKYKKTEPEEGFRLLTKEEFVKEVRPDLIEQVKKRGKVEALIAIGFLALPGTLKYGGRLLRVSSKSSRTERASYKQALKDYNTLRDSSASVKVVEQSPFASVGVEYSGIEITNLANRGAFKGIQIETNTLKNAQALKVSQSTQKLVQRYPDMKKVKQPRTKNYVYYVDSSERIIYRNIVTYEFRLTSGQTRTYSVVSYTTKPITQFRTLESTLKYGRGKKTFVGAGEEGKDIFAMKEIKKTGEGDLFLAKVDRGKVETRIPGALKKYERDVEQLFKYGEPVGISKAVTKEGKPSRLITPMFETDVKVIKEVGISKARPPIADISIAKRLADVRPPKKTGLPIERRTPLSKTFEIKPKTLDPIKMEAKIEAPTKLADQEISSQIVSQISKPPVPKIVTKLKPKVQQKTRNLLLSQQRTNQQLLQSVAQKEKLSERQKKTTIERTDLIPKNLSILKEDLIIREEQLPKERLILKQVPKLKEIQQPIQVMITPTIQVTPRVPTPKVPKKPTTLITPIFRRRGAKFVKEEPYDAFVLRDSLDPKKKRWEKINERPLTKRSADSAWAREVDQSISAQGKTVKRKPVIQKVKDKTGKIIRKVKQQVGAYDTKDKYYETNKHKFREFYQRKGTRRPLPTGRHIELQKYRLDSPGEKRGISLFRRR